jgi:phage shock protein A
MSKILGRRATDHEAALARVESSLGELVARMTERLVEAKNQVALAKRDEAMLVKQAEVVARAAESWGQRAMSAVRARDDVVAKDALVRKLECQRATEEFRAALESRRIEVERMAAALTSESVRVEETKQRRNAVVLRASRADAADAVASALRAATPEELLHDLESALGALDREARVARELSDGAIESSRAAGSDASRAESELAVLKELVKAAPRAKKPLAKTTGDAQAAESSRARAGASPARRTKR